MSRPASSVRGSTVAVALVVALLLALTGCQNSGPDLGTIPDYVTIPDEGLGPAQQTVTQMDGTAWRYAKPADGKLTLLYFGYTSCPDVCPTTLADVASALTKLPPQTRDKIWVQFVSTDPNRDTDAQMKAWLGGFDPTFHGARAPIAEVIVAAQTYGIGIEAPKVTAGDYQVTHGGQLMVLRPDGHAVGYFRDLAGSAAYVTGLPLLVDAYT